MFVRISRRFDLVPNGVGTKEERSAFRSDPIGDGLAAFVRGVLRRRRRGETDVPLAVIDR
jgi:hypothetical protein